MLGVSPTVRDMVRCQGLNPGFCTRITWSPAASRKTDGVFPINLPSTVMSAPSGWNLTVTPMRSAVPEGVVQLLRGVQIIRLRQFRYNYLLYVLFRIFGIFASAVNADLRADSPRRKSSLRSEQPHTGRLEQERRRFATALPVAVYESGMCSSAESSALPLAPSRWSRRAPPYSDCGRTVESDC